MRTKMKYPQKAHFLIQLKSKRKRLKKQIRHMQKREIEISQLIMIVEKDRK